ncbi:MAG: SIS domain-containing protein, partial [Planctomycetota bacterium]
MCGIVGFQLQESGGDIDISLALAALGTLKPESGSPPSFLEAGSQAASLTQSLIRPETFFALVDDTDMQAAASRALKRLSEILTVTEDQGARAENSLAEAENWNAAGVLFRDALWRLERDLLENLEKVGALCGVTGPTEGRETVLRHSFRLNLTLNALDRLEVRGRDSAGIGTIFWFPDEEALERFRERVAAEGAGEELAAREEFVDLHHGSVRQVPGDTPAVVFVHKTAEEIGRLGQNVRRLREAISGDLVYWLAAGSPGVTGEVLAHTRWASNGIVNEANCHPVDNRGEGDAEGPLFLAVLNGDIDNFQDLREALARQGKPMPRGVTTDAKVIPMLVAEKYEKTKDVGEAFRRALAEFEGAFAIALISTAEPGVMHLALKGSGQALYVGEAPSGVMVASETYGLVEACNRYIRLDGEKPRIPEKRETAGQIMVMTPAVEFPAGFSTRSFDGEPLPEMPEPFEAEITTRDIHRGEYEHYFLKEISEAPLSMEKTIRGKYALPGEGEDGGPVFAFGGETVPQEVLERLRSGEIGKILFIGQGTASVAAMGIEHIWRNTLDCTGLNFASFKASELSGFGLERDMSDTLVVAVSQSGTTTDTNRTVELVKSRGAAVLGIVNRRHSDLVHRADGVVYTGDGRDVEMSVASTKAFYAQVVAGTLLGLYIASSLKALPPEEITRRLNGLQRMPDLMRELLRRTDGIRALAEEHGVKKRHWAVVGSGLDRVAAEEIRIKLSELNYKSISCDFLEDKKHIDLSAEPLILVCGVSQAPTNVPDAVKEVSIFKAHRATPITIVPDGEVRYGPYAAGQIHVPLGVPELAFLLETMAGHLWGYFAARALDASAKLLKEARSAVVEALPSWWSRRDRLFGGVRRKLRARISPLALSFARAVREGKYNSGLEVDTAGALLSLFGYLQGVNPLRDFHLEFGEGGTWETLFDHFLVQASRGIGELTRPIDAIKHQAKTVTVGISREEFALTGPVFDALESAAFPVEVLDDAKRYALESVSRAVEEVQGYTLYGVEGLDGSGQPTDSATISILTREGVATTLPTRVEESRPLFGTKRSAVTRGRVILGSGRFDGRTIILIPGSPESGKAPLLLLHVKYRADLKLEDILHVLRGYYERYEEVRWAVSEIDPEFTDGKLEGIPLPALLEEEPRALALRVMTDGG